MRHKIELSSAFFNGPGRAIRLIYRKCPKPTETQAREPNYWMVLPLGAKSNNKGGGGAKKRCKCWLPKKNRFCANNTLHDSPYCGNHKPRSNGQWVPCPIDPSHSVLKENLEGHVKKSPRLKQNESLLVQKYYKKGANAGEGDDGNVTSEMKRSYVYGMNVAEFDQLVRKIKLVHELVCKDIWDSYKMPQACNMWINREVDSKLPFQEKHVMQQASILGNLEELGVIETNDGRESANEDDLDGDNGAGNGIGIDIPAVVEFGAGRGYLMQMLADFYGIKRVYLVERKFYKLKADRSLRQKESFILERLRIDSEVFKNLIWSPESF